jgi:hypothetical protein
MRPKVFTPRSNKQLFILNLIFTPGSDILDDNTHIPETRPTVAVLAPQAVRPLEKPFVLG